MQHLNLIAALFATLAAVQDEATFVIDGPVQENWQSVVGLGPPGSQDYFAEALVSHDRSVLYTTSESSPSGVYRTNTAAWASEDGSKLWQVDGVAFSSPRALTLDPSGARLFVAGGALNSGWDAALTAIDAVNGTELWSVTFDPFGEPDDRFVDVRVSPDGARVYATGWTGDHNTFEWDFLTAAFDASTGAELWCDRYAGPVREDQAEALAVSADGQTVFVVGSTRHFNGTPWSDYDFETIAYSAIDGTILWTSLVGGTENMGLTKLSEQVRCAELHPSGQFLVVTGDSTSSVTGNNDVRTVAISTTDGAELWSALWAGTDPSGSAYLPDDYVRDLSLSPDGSKAFVAMSTEDYPSVVAYDTATGTESWYTTLPGGLSADGAYGVASRADGSELLVAAHAVVGGFVAGLDVADGVPLWTAGFDMPIGTGLGGEADFVAEDDAGNVLMAGTRRNTFGEPDPWGQVGDLDVFLASFERPDFWSNEREISLSAGGTQAMHLEADELQAGAVYFVAGSLTGTMPGLPIGFVTLPLNFDSWFALTLTSPNGPNFQNTFGSLDGSGRGLATLALPPGANPNLAGWTAHHAYVLFLGPNVVFASSPIAVELVP